MSTGFDHINDGSTECGSGLSKKIDAVIDAGSAVFVEGEVPVFEFGQANDFPRQIAIIG